MTEFRSTPIHPSGTTTSTTSPRAGPRKSAGGIGSSRASVSTASRPAESSRTSIRRRSSPQDRRQSGSSGQSRPHLRQGRRDTQSLEDPDRIMYPLRRAGERGEAVGSRCRGTRRSTISADASAARSWRAAARGHVHVGRPGEDGYANRVLQAWGIDGHNSHTNVCSSSARLGHFLWCGADRPSPDYANAQTILLLSRFRTGPPGGSSNRSRRAAR